jgi:putative nucleotidyltransferase with HDIG domain
MKLRPIIIYVWVVCALAVASQALLQWSDFFMLSDSDLAGLAALTVLGFISESLALTVRFGGSAGNSSITFLPLLACVIVFGPTPAVVFLGVTGLVAERGIRKKEAMRAYFNLGQYLLSTTLAGLVFLEWGGIPQVLSGADHFQLQLGPALLFGLTFLAVNHVAVSIAVAIDQRRALGTVLVKMIGSAGTNVFYDLLVLPIALAVAFLYVELQISGLLLVIMPLLFIRYSYLTNHKLVMANRDLLKALVKAIETRDPYTSGHSMRVAGLAVRIGEGLHLSKRKLGDVETAALLHDIGKIEGVYAEILAKPDKLSSTEREVIESHVLKGVELLEGLASYPKAILDGVRHHHERMDGSGYPDRLQGDRIPLIARIINVCDAIDAMLSDRPYRSALTVEQVHAELVRCAGRHFDVGIVSLVAGSDILEQHAQEVQAIPGELVDRFVVEPVSDPGPRWAASRAVRGASERVAG